MRIIVMTMLLGVTLAAQAEEVQQYPVLREELVNVLNEFPLMNSNRMFNRGDECLISRGGRMKEVGQKNSAVAVVSYTPPGNTSMTLCPRGAQFHMPRQELRALLDAQHKAREVATSGQAEPK